MTAEPRTIYVPAGSELARALEDAARGDREVVADTGAARYRLHIEPAEPADDTKIECRPQLSPAEVEASIAAIKATAGAWKDFDAEAFKAYIRERRKTSSRPPVQW